MPERSVITDKEVTKPAGPKTKTLNGFVSFIRENAVVGLAVGFVIGAQVQSVVKQLIASFVDPLFQLLFGQALSQRIAVFHFNGHTADFAWGSFAYVLIDFLFVLLTVYFIIKILKLDKLDKPKK